MSNVIPKAPPENCWECPNLVPKKMIGDWAQDVECRVLRRLRADCLVCSLQLLHEEQTAAYDYAASDEASDAAREKQL